MTALAGCFASRGNNARNGAQAAIQCQFTEKFMLVNSIPGYLSRGCQNTQCDRQVETPALLGKVCRGEIDGNSAVWKCEV